MDNVWSVEGTISGMPLKRHMVVARLPDGRLLLHSVVAMNDAEMAMLDGLGDVAFIVAPGPGHRIDVARYHARYPKAQVLAPAASRAKITEKCPVDSTCEDALAAVPGVRALPIPGLPVELAYEIETGAGKVIVLNDVLGHGAAAPGLGGWVFGLLGTPEGKLGLPRIVRFVQVKDRAGVRTFVGGLAQRDDVVAVTLSHGSAVTGEVRGQLREATSRV